LKNAISVEEFSKLVKVPENSALVLEDIINLRKKEEPIFRELINRKCHHKLLYIYAIAHHIYKTGVHSTIPNFDYIIFTNNKANVPILERVLAIFKTPASELIQIKNFISSTPSKFDQYYVYSTKYNQLYFASSTRDLLAGKNLQVLVTQNQSETSIMQNEDLGTDLSSNILQKIILKRFLIN